MSLFRFDGWVRNVLGQALAGVQVYVCTQPANTTDIPPSPLASVFSDVNGLLPITQPISSDGFGHYDFYVASGFYTIVEVIGGTIKQVYPDQSPMGSGGQSLTAGTNITIAGNTISAADAPVTSVAGKTGAVTLVEGDITGLVSDLALKSPLDSPSLTGIPTAPTAAPGTNTTQLATTAFVLANAGGSGQLLKAQVTMLAADIKNMWLDTPGTGTPFVVLPAQGAGKAAIPVLVTFQYVPGSQAFNVPGGHSFSGMLLSFGQHDDLAQGQVVGAGFWDGLTGNTAIVSCIISTGNVPFTSTISTEDLVIINSDASAGANPTLGDGSVVITVYYTLLNLS